jgi:hypothetical protein
MRPTLEERKHAQSSALDGVNVGEFDNHYARISLGKNYVAQPVGRIALYNSAFALNNSDVSNHLDMYVEHGCLLNSIFSVARAGPSAKNIHFLCSEWRYRCPQGGNFGES